MKITVLVENTACGTNLKGQHGLSFFIETDKCKILFDCGADNLFLENAAKLGLDISAVDYFVLSHGHYDHGGGLKDFLKANDKAKIFVSRYAFNDYFFKVLFFKKYVGLDKSLKNNSRIIFVDGEYKINNASLPGANMVIFSDISGSKYCSVKSKLLKSENGKIAPDDFRHEQCLIIDKVLFAGCSHTGIVNIYEKAKSISAIRYIFGGFHLYNPVTKKTEDRALIENIANEFKNEDIKIYTGHCTGKKSFEVLESVLGKKIEEISTGKVYEV
jgi:7,8-dihydropterin-6-yl-methyl-4-(beta-D-ribofuranosyl)aminobenzene 5'-phosphate synthase